MPNQLDEIKERREKATKGPWMSRLPVDLPLSVVPKQDAMHTICEIAEEHGNADYNAAFIAHSWSDIGWLIEEVERLRKESSEALREFSVAVRLAEEVEREADHAD